MLSSLPGGQLLREAHRGDGLSWLEEKSQTNYPSISQGRNWPEAGRAVDSTRQEERSINYMVVEAILQYLEREEGR